MNVTEQRRDETAAAWRALRSQIGVFNALRARIERGEIDVNTAIVASLVDAESAVRYTLLEANKRFGRVHHHHALKQRRAR